MGRDQGTIRGKKRMSLVTACERAAESIARSTTMLELKVGDRVRSREEGVTGTVMRREHDFEHPRYVIAWDNGELSEIGRMKIQLWRNA